MTAVYRVIPQRGYDWIKTSPELETICGDIRKRNVRDVDKEKTRSARVSRYYVNIVPITFRMQTQGRQARELSVFACRRYACYVYARRVTLFWPTGLNHGRGAIWHYCSLLQLESDAEHVENVTIDYMFVPVSCCSVSAGLLLLPHAGLCKCCWLLWTVNCATSRDRWVSSLLCPVITQGMPVWGGHESLLPNWWTKLRTAGEEKRPRMMDLKPKMTIRLHVSECEIVHSWICALYWTCLSDLIRDLIVYTNLTAWPGKTLTSKKQIAHGLMFLLTYECELF